jgi:hypothetical protein
MEDFKKERLDCAVLVFSIFNDVKREHGSGTVLFF